VNDVVPVEAGKMVSLAPGVRRLTAPNPGMMTGPGTNSYLVGNASIAIIDPGPDIGSHLQQLAAAGNIEWIFVTHTHPDHSPGARTLQSLTGATLIGAPAPDAQHQDATFVPQRIPTHGERFEVADFTLHMLHTPGHASNHFCFLHEEYKWLFTGDHIMGGSTVVIDPPDGDMQSYLQSLDALKHIEIRAIAPGHGPLFHNVREEIDALIEHRLGRERKVVAALDRYPDSSVRQLVPVVYRDVDESLFGWAERSLLAHLIKLEKEGRAARNKACWRLIDA
jgi:glyoxylase-like metal-dependent hydrolase (beta-lactamase superfamily II)